MTTTITHAILAGGSIYVMGDVDGTPSWAEMAQTPLANSTPADVQMALGAALEAAVKNTPVLGQQAFDLTAVLGTVPTPITPPISSVKTAEIPEDLTAWQR